MDFNRGGTAHPRRRAWPGQEGPPCARGAERLVQSDGGRGAGEEGGTHALASRGHPWPRRQRQDCGALLGAQPQPPPDPRAAMRCTSSSQRARGPASRSLLARPFSPTGGQDARWERRGRASERPPSLWRATNRPLRRGLHLLPRGRLFPEFRGRPPSRRTRARGQSPGRGCGGRPRKAGGPAAGGRGQGRQAPRPHACKSW